MIDGINPITVINDSRFSHYLIDHECRLELKMYEDMYLQLNAISDIMDELERMDKWYYIPLSMIQDVVDFGKQRLLSWKQHTLKSKLFWISFWICCVVFGFLVCSR